MTCIPGVLHRLVGSDRRQRRRCHRTCQAHRHCGSPHLRFSAGL